MSAVIEGLEVDRLVALAEARRLRDENGELRAEVADLKARLKALRARWCDCGGCLDCEAVARIGNLRLKDWRKP